MPVIYDLRLIDDVDIRFCCQSACLRDHLKESGAARNLIHTRAYNLPADIDIDIALRCLFCCVRSGSPVVLHVLCLLCVCGCIFHANAFSVLHIAVDPKKQNSSYHQQG